MENYVNRPLSDKSMKFCIMVDHDPTYDFSHNSNQNRSQNSLFFGKIVQILCKNRKQELSEDNDAPWAATITK